MKLLEKLGIDEINPGCSTGKWWSDTNKDDLLATINPSTEKVIAHVTRATSSDYEKIITTSIDAFTTWRLVPAPIRGELIRQIGDALRDKKDLLGSLIALEMGKIKQEGDGEVQEMIDVADFAVGQSRMLYGKTMHSERPQHRMYEQWHPLGPVAVICAFNFPVAVWAWNAFIAAICGNTIIWKPSPKTPLCSLAVQKICNKVMAANGYDGIFSLFISDDNKMAAEFVADKRLPLISFTGSTVVGRKVAQTVAERLGKSILELSGNNAIIVDEKADLDLAVPSIVFGSAGTAGQRCTSTRRVFVHESKLEELTKRLVAAYEQIKVGDPLQKDVLMGPLIDPVAVDSFHKAVTEVKAQGGEILFGGNALDGNGYFVEPTIAVAKNDFVIVQCETFAPILYLIPYNDFDEAIAMHNAVPQGLSSAIFTTDLRRAEQFLSAIGSDCGIANVNIGTSGAEIGGAFGGEKDTGGGRESGSDAWKAYMRRQTNTINWSCDLPLAQGIKFVI